MLRHLLLFSYDVFLVLYQFAIPMELLSSLPKKHQRFLRINLLGKKVLLMFVVLTNIGSKAGFWFLLTGRYRERDYLLNNRIISDLFDEGMPKIEN